MNQRMIDILNDFSHFETRGSYFVYFNIDEFINILKFTLIEQYKAIRIIYLMDEFIGVAKASMADRVLDYKTKAGARIDLNQKKEITDKNFRELMLLKYKCEKAVDQPMTETINQKLQSKVHYFFGDIAHLVSSNAQKTPALGRGGGNFNHLGSLLMDKSRYNNVQSPIKQLMDRAKDLQIGDSRATPGIKSVAQMLVPGLGKFSPSKLVSASKRMVDSARSLKAGLGREGLFRSAVVSGADSRRLIGADTSPVKSRNSISSSPNRSPSPTRSPGPSSQQKNEFKGIGLTPLGSWRPTRQRLPEIDETDGLENISEGSTGAMKEKKEKLLNKNNPIKPGSVSFSQETPMAQTPDMKSKSSFGKKSDFAPIRSANTRSGFFPSNPKGESRAEDSGGFMDAITKLKQNSNIYVCNENSR